MNIMACPVPLSMRYFIETDRKSRNILRINTSHVLIMIFFALLSSILANIAITKREVDRM